jgi:23S rRNA pseudouridine1911/1915/1917 synthase
MKYFVEEDSTLSSFLEKKFTKKQVKQYLKNREVFVNGRIQMHYQFLVKAKDEITLVKRLENDILLLYEDRDLLVVDKPYHMLTVADTKNRENTLYAQLSAYVKRKNKKEKIYIVHRLDYETAGIMVFAKSEEIKEKLQKNWQEVLREYQALVYGKVKNKDTLQFHLKENRAMRVYVTKKDFYTKEAITEYTRIGFKKDISFVNITIKTGRKHQIRVSFKEIGSPILGDRKYGRKDAYKHLYLYASKLVFKHPKTGKKLVFIKPIPDDFSALM